MIEQFFSSLLLLLLILDPIGMVPIFLHLTESHTPIERRYIAFKATLYSCVLLLFFGVFGEKIFQVLGIQTTTVRLAGGILLFVIALDMIFEVRSERRSKTKAGAKIGSQERKAMLDRLAISPLSIPLIAGPGAITAIIILLAEHEKSLSMQAGVDLFALLLVMGIVYTCLALGSTFLRVFGANVFALLSRLLGMMLAMLAVQIIIDALPGFWFTN